MLYFQLFALKSIKTHQFNLFFSLRKSIWGYTSSVLGEESLS